ncbi:MAG: hypothetical protein HY962_07695 [Ignavibacteriae bacterium]|nr:hypothetical protein [Ignavibacteriota bacterium]
MKRYRMFLLAVAGALAIAGCSDKSPSTNINDPAAQSRLAAIDEDRLVRNALEIVPGSVSSVSTNDAETPLLSVTVAPASGGSVIVTFDAVNNVIAAVSGDAATHTASVAPGPYFIPLSLAVELAQREVRGNVLGWRFERNADDNTWIYRIEIRDSTGLRHDIALNAISKSIIAANIL